MRLALTTLLLCAVATTTQAEVLTYLGTINRTDYEFYELGRMTDQGPQALMLPSPSLDRVNGQLTWAGLLPWRSNYTTPNWPGIPGNYVQEMRAAGLVLDGLGVAVTGVGNRPITLYGFGLLFADASYSIQFSAYRMNPSTVIMPGATHFFRVDDKTQRLENWWKVGDASLGLHVNYAAVAGGDTMPAGGGLRFALANVPEPTPWAGVLTLLAFGLLWGLLFQRGK